MKKIIAVVSSYNNTDKSVTSLCSEAGIPIHVPYVGDIPANAGNAYRVDSVIPPIPDDATVLRIECDGPAFAGIPDDRIIVIDHHRPGDPGYGRPPAEYWLASSIGQVAQHVGRHMVASGRAPEEVGLVGDKDGPYWPIETYPLLAAAAADHCLTAAYRGECPGVDPDELMWWRAECRAVYQGRSTEAVLADIEAARKKLRAALQMQQVEYHAYISREYYHPPGWRTVIADMRNYGNIPELPEAAALEDIPFISSFRCRDGRENIVLQAAPPDLVRRFMAGDIIPGMENIYGDPDRGFAGGYIT